MTNAGKTYTITGTEENPGLLPRTLAETFRSVEAVRAAASKGTSDRLVVVVSYIEVHNEQVYDLLSQAAAAAGAAGSQSAAAAASNGTGPQPSAAATQKAAKASAAAQATAAQVVREPLAVKDGRCEGLGGGSPGVTGADPVLCAPPLQ